MTDEVRDFALSNALALDLDNAELEQLRNIYPNAGELVAILADDREIYTVALARANLDIDDAEPIGSAFAAFEADVGLPTAAAVT